jgi:pimeloyl-ACP methyl ester carboxylesterase
VAWAAEGEALDRGDVDGAVAAVLAAWLQSQAPPALRESIASMQRRAVELQLAVPDVEEAPDPLEQDPEMIERLTMPVLAVAGQMDMSDFIYGAEQIARLVADGEVATIAGAGHLAPLEAPAEFEALLRRFLRAHA